MVHRAGPKRVHALVPVRVVHERAERTVALSSPGGHRIEILSLQEAVAVLRALG
jgi:hypothetical protein